MTWMRVLFCCFALLDIALAVQLTCGSKGWMEYVRLKQTHDRLAAQIETVSTRNMALSEEIRLIKKSPAYVERMARAEFNFVAPNEILYLFEPLSKTKHPRTPHD
ncbi:FtsB family cell division protein [Desulfoplanes formicivorans]|uniref:Septum formation initiator n=1 Tax=Desulfoplanes formicivorans TaxID=1592317 RepID=A0A194AF86_9BACT|nr:septum formation initiator family protein [Desulfoplanes formicivorans]GAU07860.1 septum formation initiator [Desulfoplanes formicivorans]